MKHGPVLHGVVSEFDEPRGIGAVASADGGAFFFHCTAIAGGGRRIEVGTQVAFVLKAGHVGQMEVKHLTPLSDLAT